jgi:hypothetical protein
MTKRFCILATAAFLVPTALTISSSSAQILSPYVFSGTLGWPYGFYQDEHIPYYSLHPPVYYSQPVPRTYGWSPWAYPPGVMTPDVAPVPEIIENPHIEKNSAPKRGVTRPKPTSDRAASYIEPQLIENPYVRQLADR